MRRTTFGQATETRRRAALSVDARALIEGHLRDLARAGRLCELAHSRNALVRYYREQGNGTAVYCLATAPDFSLAATPVMGQWPRQFGRAEWPPLEMSSMVHEERHAMTAFFVVSAVSTSAGCGGGGAGTGKARQSAFPQAAFVMLTAPLILL